jgi:hypothetical protein
MVRIRWAAVAVTLGLSLLVASPAQASLQLGQLSLGSNPFGCNDGSFIVQTGVASGPDYRVPPGGGVITGWSARTFSTGGPDQILQLAVIGNNVSGDFVTFEGLSAFEHLAPVPPSGTVYSFTTRIPVNGGERIGLYAQDKPPGPEAFTWACAVANTSGNADRDIWGDLSAAVIGGPPALATHGQFLSQRVPVEAKLEVDADHDNFGDETQDQCPTNATTQGPCPVPTSIIPTSIIPDTSITKHPKAKTKGKGANFKFTATVPGATFECKIDSGAFKACTSPHHVNVGKGKHSFAVRATANGQTDPTPAIFKWKVERKQPAGKSR